MEKSLEFAWLNTVFPECEIEEKECFGHGSNKSVKLLTVSHQKLVGNVVYVVFEIFNELGLATLFGFDNYKKAEGYYLAVLEGLSVGELQKSSVLMRSEKIY